MNGFESPPDPLGASPMPSDPGSDGTTQEGSKDSAASMSPMKRLILEVLLVIGIAFPLALVLHTFVTQVYAISGHSMEPTLFDGERVMVDKVSPAISEISRGDLIIFASPEDDSKNLIKRVIGLAGDKIELIGEVVYINDKPLRESYTRRTIFPQKPGESIIVEDGFMFVLGDNRPQSRDSRDFGTVSVDQVKGKVLLRLWPLDALKLF
ncbi:MAG: signal peptidase I [Planctomycetia bacterium TMED53]|nr:MAG: signal peptidase I [Planctomycetia bacterium TMED53]